MSRDVYTSFSTVLSCPKESCSEGVDDGREIYTTLMMGEDGKKQIEEKIVNPALIKEGLQKTEPVPIKVRVINDKMESTDYVKTGTFTVGRHLVNDIIIDDPLGTVSRIHFAVFFANNKIVILDTWSLHGTSTIKNSTHEKVSSTMGDRKIISFDIGVRFMIQIESFTLIFNQDMESPTAKNCIICCSNPRSMRFKCGHCTTCEECTKIIMNGSMCCPICKEHVDVANASGIFDTWLQMGS